MFVRSGLCAAVGGLRGLLARRGGLFAISALLAGALPALADTFTVVNTQDAGPGSLRAAIDAANTTPNSTIEFNIPTSDPGFNLPGSPNAWRITLTSALPSLAQPVTINGLTQPGAICGSPRIELNGQLAGTSTYGLVALADGCVVRGLSITRFFLGGILLQSADNCRVACNNIGLTGDGAPAGNGRGVVISNAGNNTVGGSEAPATVANRIAFNTGAGVAVTGLSPTPIGNYILGNAIHDNGGLGIDLADNGVTPNDLTDLDLGPNGLQNFPVIQSVVNNVITGSLNSLPDRMFRIEFFASPAADPSAFGEGTVYLGSIDVGTSGTGVTNAFSFPFTPPANARFIAATATALPSPRGVPGVPPTGTSEFSGAVEFFTGGTNNPPVASNLSSTTPEDTDAVLTLPATDPDNDTLTLRVATLPSQGTLLQFGTLAPITTPGTNLTDPARRVVFRPVPQASGTPYASFTFIANDSQADSNTATVTINVTAVNDAPVAADDAYITTEDTTLSVLAPGVLGNDSDIDTPASGLRAEALTQPAHGTLTLGASGSIQYVPAGNYNGPDSFTYRVLDDANAPSNTATVRITVTPLNDAPIAVDDAYSTDEDTPLLVPQSTGVLANDSDVDGDGLTAGDATTLIPAGSGAVTLNADGSLSFTPAANFSGIATFTYRARDGVLPSAPATVRITVRAVNDGPVAVDDTYSTDEDTPLVISTRAAGVLANDTDIDTPNSALTAAGITQPSSGTLVLNPDGTFTYSPNANFSGTDSFTYRASDGQLNSQAATVRITVRAVNDGPVAADDTYSTDEDTPLVISTRAAGVLANDTDIDTPNSALTAAGLTQPSSGTLVLNPDGTFTYSPNANFNGTDSFTYHASDGQLNSQAATVRITVRAVNDAPVAVADAYTTDEDTALVVSTRALGVLNNDTDTDTPAASLTAAGVSTPSNGTLTLNSDGTFTYTPTANFEGTDTFTYRANDGELNSLPTTVTITVRGVNDPPVAVNDAYTTDEDTPLTVSLATLGVLRNDTDPDGPAPLTAVLVSTTTRGTLTFASAGTFNYNPNPNFNGTDTFTYRARDGAGAESNLATVTITVGPVNDPPVARNDTFLTDEDVVLTVNPPGVLDNDSDADNPLNTLLITVQAQPANGSVSLANGGIGGGFVYTPNANFNGNDSFTYRLNDGQANSNTATVTIVVRPLNDAPVANDDAYSTPEDTTLTVTAPQGVLANDTDVDSPPAALTAAGVTQPSHGSLTLAANGSLVYAPDANFSGTDTFTYRASDGQPGGISNIATVTIRVGPVNDPPVALNDSYIADQNTPLIVAPPGVLGNDTDPDSPPASLTAIGASLPANGVLSLQPNGGFTYTPNTDYVGPDSFTYRASDGTDQSGVAVVNITVRAVGQNLPPVARCRDITIDARSTCPPPEAFFVTSQQVNNGSSDPDNDVAELQFRLSNTGPFRVGATQVTLTVTDPGGLFSTCTATITVLGEDCNRNGVPDACDIANGAADCNRDGVPDECQCLWDNGMATPAGAKANSLSSHQGGGRGNGRVINTRTADDFYLPPGQVHQITSFSGQMITSVLPSVRRARVDFFEDCDGRPADAPFASFTNSVVLDSVAVPSAGPGFDLVTFAFDLCDAKLWLDGDRTYWVALSGLGLCGDQSESYWATSTVTGNPDSQLKCSVPHRQNGDATIAACLQTSWNPWTRADACCGGCADMAFKVGGRSCDIIWDNGDAEHCPPVNVAGIPSGTQGGRLLRAADNFVIRACQDRRLCFVEASIFTNASPAVIQSTGFLEIFTNKCDWPRQRVATARVCKVVPTHAMVTVEGATLSGYKLQFIAPEMNITLIGGQTYWLSAGVNPGGGFATKSYFAYGRRCEAPPGCDYQITPAAMATLGNDPETSNLFWCAGSAALDLAFRIAADPLRSPMMPPGPLTTCPADVDQSGNVSVQDLFDFVTAWLAGCP